MTTPDRNNEKLREQYNNNRALLNKYPYWFGQEIPGYDELDFTTFLKKENIFVVQNKTTGGSFEIEINSDRETEYFFSDLSKPLLIENETNEYNLHFLVDNVRASEDVAMDNHIYLHYSDPNILFSAMQAFDFASLLEREKIVFLVGENEGAAYPIDFKKKYNIDYSSMTPRQIQLQEMNRLCFWYKHTGAGTWLSVRALGLNSTVISTIGWFFFKTGFTRTPEYIHTVMDDSATITREKLIDFLDNSDIVNSLEGIDGVSDFVSTTYKDKDFFTPAELFRAYFIFRVSKMDKSPRVIPLIVCDPHDDGPDGLAKYEKIMESFKYLTVMTTFREPIVCFARNYENGWLPDEFYLKKELMSEYSYARFLSKKFYDRYYAFRFEDLKQQPADMLKSVCVLLNIPFDEEMLSAKAALTDKQGDTVSGFDPKPLNRDISNVFSDFDIMRLKIFYAPIHKYYGYDYFDEQEHNMDADSVIKLLSYPFRFEMSGYASHFYKYSSQELREWIRETLAEYYHVGRTSKYILPKLIKPYAH